MEGRTCVSAKYFPILLMTAMATLFHAKQGEKRI